MNVFFQLLFGFNLTWQRLLEHTAQTGALRSLFLGHKLRKKNANIEKNRENNCDYDCSFDGFCYYDCISISGSGSFNWWSTSGHDGRFNTAAFRCYC
jgi:hypothetical protein